MSMDIYSVAPSVAKKRRTYSKEFKPSIVNACRDPNASVTLKHGLNANLVSRLIRNFHHHDSAVQDPAHVKPAFIALPYTVAIRCDDHTAQALLQIAANGNLNTLLAKGSADECFPWSSFSGRNHSLGRPLVL